MTRNRSWESHNQKTLLKRCRFHQPTPTLSPEYGEREREVFPRDLRFLQPILRVVKEEFRQRLVINGQMSNLKSEK